MQHRKEIDGLRALAVLPVVLYHAQIPGFAGGFVGVDIFFVISGYLITSILRAELEHETFSIARFYERRIRRLWPALFVVLAVSMILSIAWLSPSDARDFFKSLITVTLFGSNIYFSQTTGYFSTAAELKPLLHTWSLAVEEQYYFFFPVFLMLAWRLARRRVVALLALLLLASLGFALVYVDQAPNRAFFSTFARCWELLMGAMAALHLVTYPPSHTSGWKREAGGVVGLGLIVAVIPFEAPMSVPGVYSLLPTVGAVLIILFAWPGTLAGKLLSYKAMVTVGLLSYSLYLWHQPLMALARIRSVGIYDATTMIYVIVATFALAYLTWRYVETPFRQRDRFPARQIVAAAILGSGTFLAVGLVALISDYTTLRYGERKAVLSRQVWSTLKPAHLCLQDFDAVQAKECVFGDVNSKRTLAVIGDSHAAQWTDALDQLGRDAGIRVTMFAKSACASASVTYRYYALRREYWECTQWRKNVLAQIGQRNFDAVLITNSSAGYAGKNGPVTLPEWKNGVRDFSEQVSRHTRRVFWLIDNPRFPVNPFSCFEANFWQDEHRHCSVSRSEAVDQRLINAEREALGSMSSVTVTDFLDFFCDTTRCVSIMKDEPVMQDTNHLTAKVTLALQPRLASVVKTAF